MLVRVALFLVCVANVTADSVTDQGLAAMEAKLEELTRKGYK